VLVCLFYPGFLCIDSPLLGVKYSTGWAKCENDDKKQDDLLKKLAKSPDHEARIVHLVVVHPYRAIGLDFRAFLFLLL
jgi:hypothetical protein